MSRVNRLILCLTSLSCLLLTGCWDYRGLNELTIVTGFAIDVAEGDEPGFSLTFETVDMTGDSDSEYTSTLLCSEGETVAEAVKNASVKLHNDMYLGNAEVVIVSRELAEDLGLRPVLDYLLRDRDSRDNMNIVVSGEDSAGALLEPADEEEGGGGIRAFTLSQNLDQHENHSNSTHSLELYQIYNLLALDTTALALPLVLNAEEDGGYQLSGMALFTGDRMTGTLDEEAMPYYLRANTTLEGGGYGIDVENPEGEPARIVIGNHRSTPKLSCAYDGERLHFTIHLLVRGDVLELSPGWAEIDNATMRELEDQAGKALSREVSEMAESLRDDGYDIIGFAEALRNRDPALWDEIADDWDRWLRGSEITVETRVELNSTGMIEQY